jgi:ankyrin repeat protein
MFKIYKLKIMNKHTFDPLFYNAICRKNLSKIQELINDNNVNGWDLSGNAFLSLAMSSFEIFKWMIDNGGDCNIKNISPDELSLLHLSVGMSNNTDVVKFLLDKGVSINEQTKDGNTPLHLAVISDNKEVVEILCADESIEIDKMNNEGRTALHYAAENGFHDVSKILLEGNANPSVCLNDLTCFYLAVLEKTKKRHRINTDEYDKTIALFKNYEDEEEEILTKGPSGCGVFVKSAK